MDKLLIISATEAECKPALHELTECKIISPCLYSGTLHGQPVEILISGIGSVATAYRLTQTLMQRSYCRAISIGIAGSFVENIPVGETVQITEDCFADLGIDNNGQFRSLREAGLTSDDCDSDFIINSFPVSSPHRKVRGVTVQTASGSLQRIETLVSRFHPQVETMENGAFFYVCRQMQVPFVSFRAISNRVEPRNPENWRITEAVESVHQTMVHLLHL